MSTFKLYEQNQTLLFPANIGDKIEKKHIARVISKLIDKLDTTEIENSYSAKGCNAYHPKMLLKISRGSSPCKVRIISSLIFTSPKSALRYLNRS